MAELIDISPPLSSALPTWPQSTPFVLERTASIGAGSEANVSALTLDAHMGAHLDSPLHGLAGGADIGELEIDRVVGEAFVAQAPEEAAELGPGELEEMGVPARTSRLLLRTANSSAPLYRRSFTDAYTALSSEGARWVAERGTRLIGIDYLSIQPIGHPFDTHRILFENDVWILEGLDLTGVEPGHYELICLPLNLPEAEAAPCRAVLRPLR